MQTWFEKLKKKASALKGETYILYLAYRHPITPWYAKVFAAIVVAYAFSPIDMIPDFIPVLGYLDDLILVLLGISLALKMIPQEALDAAREQASAEKMQGRPIPWVAGVIILLIWLTLGVLIILWIVQWIQTLTQG